VVSDTTGGDLAGVSVFKMRRRLSRQVFRIRRTVAALMSANERSTNAVQESLDRRDNGGETGH